MDIEAYLAAGGKIGSPDNAPPRYRGEILKLMAIFVDSEMAGAAGFADRINDAPGLTGRIVAARMVLEKFANAERVLKLMETFGANSSRYVNQHPWSDRLERDCDLGTKRIDGDMRLNVFHYPFTGWGDSVVMNVLMGLATVVQLEEMIECSYQPLGDAFSKILPIENHHAELGIKGVKNLIAVEGDIDTLQQSVNYWHPRVADTFGRADSDRLDLYLRFGLRQRTNESLQHMWRERCDKCLGELGFRVPIDD